jgi:hypothetical protein
LNGIYLAVAENTPIGQKWKHMGAEAFFGEVKTNAHPAPDSIGTMQEFANGALWDTGHGVFYLSRAVYEKWFSPSVQSSVTATGDPVRHTLATPIEDTFATVEHGEALRFQGGAIVVRAELQSAAVIFGAIYALYRTLGDLADPAHQPRLGVPVTDETIAPIVSAASTISRTVPSTGPPQPGRMKCTARFGTNGPLRVGSAAPRLSSDRRNRPP